MSGSNIHFPKVGPMVSSAALIAVLLLGGCSGRDAAGAEKLAAANAAADRADKAAVRAEAAAAKIEKAGQPTIIEADPDTTEDAQDSGVPEEDQPQSTEPDVKT